MFSNRAKCSFVCSSYISTSLLLVLQHDILTIADTGCWIHGAQNVTNSCLISSLSHGFGLRQLTEISATGVLEVTHYISCLIRQLSLLSSHTKPKLLNDGKRTASLWLFYSIRFYALSESGEPAIATKLSAWSRN